MVWEIRVQSQVKSYQWLKKWYLMLPCLTLSIIRYGQRVKWSNPGNGVALSPTPLCSSYGKGSLRITLNYGCVTYKRVVARKIRLMRRFSLFCLLNKWNKQVDEISGRLVGGCLFGDERLLWSGRMVLSGDALQAASDSTGVWPLFGLFICSWFQTPAPENTTCGKKWLVEK